MTLRNSSHRRAITLIEVVISIVLVSTLLLASLTASANLMRNDHDQRSENAGLAFAQQLTDEITSLRFRDALNPVYGLEPDEDASDRTTFDDVDDYDGYSQVSPTHRDGTPVVNMQNWTLSVTVQPADPVTGGVTTSGATESSPLRWITVQCVSPTGETVQTSSIASDVPMTIPPRTSFERLRRVILQFPDRDVEITTPLRNHPLTN